MKSVYVIWEDIPHRDIKDHKEVVGVVVGTAHDANQVLENLRNPEREMIIAPFKVSRFWKEEVELLVP